MKLQAGPDKPAIDFGPVLIGSGTLGFFGKGYWYERLKLPLHLPTLRRGRLTLQKTCIPLLEKMYRPLFTDATFVTKSLVLDGESGHMRLRGPEHDYEPHEKFPACIYVGSKGLWHGMALNAVSLSSPPAKDILEIGLMRHRWKKTKTQIADYYSKTGMSSQTVFKPFVISFAPNKKTRRERVAEVRGLVLLLQSYTKANGIAHWLREALALQVNVKNVDPKEVAVEAEEYLDILAELPYPVMLKVDLLVPVLTLMHLGEHPALAGVCLTNTATFGQVLPEEWWKKTFPSGSPLAHLGGGALSGAPLLPYVSKRVRELRREGFAKPMNVGGGILHWTDVDDLVKAGLRPFLDSIMIGSVAMLRPWRIKSITERSQELLCPDILPQMARMAA